MQPKRVLVYRNELLPPTETFIVSQANALRRFQPLFAGLRQLRDGLDLSPHQVFLLSTSDAWHEKVKYRAFLRIGRPGQLARRIAEQGPQLIHAHFAVDGCAVLPVAEKLKVPLIVTLHGYDVSCNEGALKRWPATRAYLRRRRDLWEFASLFICVSDSVRRRALSIGFPDEKLWVHHIGTELCDLENQGEKRRREKIVLFAGRLVEKKGCVHLIRAMDRVSQAVPDARLVVAGEGPLRKSLEDKAASCCGSAVFLGHQPHEAVKQWMRRACVLAVPSIEASNGDCEGLPTVLCEAQAEGLPVVAFETEGVREALPMDRRESLPKAGDIDALSEEMIRLLQDDQLWQRVSDAGKRHVRTHFDLAAQTRLLEDKYEEVLARVHA